MKAEPYEDALKSLGRSVTKPKGSDGVTALDIHSIVERGIDGAAIRHFARYYGLPASDMTRLLGLTRRTLQRREKEERIPQRDSDRLWRAALILSQATEALGSREKARSWLHRENRALGGAAPIDLLGSEAGYQEVRDVLGRIEWGVWS